MASNEETEPLQNNSFGPDLQSVSDNLKAVGPNAWVRWNSVENATKGDRLVTNYKKIARSEGRGQFHDVWALVTFWVIVAGVLFAAGFWGVQKIFLGYLKAQSPPAGNGAWKLVLTAGAGGIALGITFALALVTLVMSLGGRVIKAGMVGISSLVLGVSVGVFFLPNPWNWALGTVSIIFTVCFFFLLWWIWNWLRLSEAVLDVAVEGLKSSGGAWGTLTLFIIIQLVWAAVWFLALAGINAVTDIGATIVGVQTLSSEPAGAPVAPAAAWAIFIGMLVILLWGMSNFNSVVGFVTAASVARWASVHYKTSSLPADPTTSNDNACSDMNRGMGPSFGTLATANLIYPATEPVRTMAAFASNPAKKRDNVLLWAMGACTSTCMACLADSTPYMSRLVPAMVAIRGGSYCAALEDTRKVLGHKHSGWIAVFNRDYNQSAFFGLTFVCAVISAATLGVCAHLFGSYFGNLPGTPMSWAVAAAIEGFIIVYMLVSMAVGLFTSATAAVYLCFFDAPYTMMQNRQRDADNSNSFIRLGSAVQATVDSVVAGVDRREPMLV